MVRRSDIRILIIDDEEIVRDSMASWLRGEGYEIVTAGSGLEALALFETQVFDIALVDLKMPEMDGIQVTERIRQECPDTLCLIMTAQASVETAVEAMKRGAYDYIIKPFYPEEVSLVIERISRHLKIVEDNKILKTKIDKKISFGCILSSNAKMFQLFDVAKQVANSNATVLILGESGTGKELLARAIHDDSPRKHFPFIPVACAALSETLLEDEIFGHEKGAFTDAKEMRKGKFELADSGTVFLDEIGDISPKLQLDLLRVIQEKEFTRLGGNQMIHVDVRIISATNRNIEKSVLMGEFREDLYYRLNVISLMIPPLRDRREDVPLLVRHFIKKKAIESQQVAEVEIRKEAMKLLMEYTFPGNVRELESAIEHAVILCKDNIIKPEDLPLKIRDMSGAAREEEEYLSLEAMEKKHIRKVLEENDYNISKSSKILGIDQSTLYAKIEKYNLERKGN